MLSYSIQCFSLMIIMAIVLYQFKICPLYVFSITVFLQFYEFFFLFYSSLTSPKSQSSCYNNDLIALNSP